MDVQSPGIAILEFPNRRGAIHGRHSAVSKAMRGAWVMLRTSMQADPRLTLVMFLLSAASQMTTTLFALWLKLLTNGVVEGNFRTVALAAAAMGTSSAMSECALWSSWKIRVILQERVSLLLDSSIIEQTAGLPGIEHHERPDYQDRLGLLKDQRESMVLTVGLLVNFVGLLVRTVTTLILLTQLHPALLLLPAFALPSLASARRSTRLIHEAAEGTMLNTRSARHLFQLATTSSPAKELRIFGLGRELIDRHRDSWAHVDDVKTAAAIKAASISAAGWVIFAAGYVGSIVFVVSLAAGGSRTPGDVLMALVLASQVRGQVSGGVSAITSLLSMLRGVEHYLWLIDYATSERATRNSHENPMRVPGGLSHGIYLRDVSFKYPGTDRLVLSNVDVKLPAGSTVAIVGENGAGKTTLVKLLMRFYEPTEGRIEIDGNDLRSYDLDSWRANLSAGFQDFAKPELTAFEVVGIGDLPHIDDEPAVTSALERAGAIDVVQSLPSGIASQLGRSFVDGVDLSGGQWQKLALGRAMMRESPILLVLDEPTASLDAETEYRLFERYAGAAKRAAGSNRGVTVLVSHRFSTVRMADLVIVLDGGRVVEVGGHEDLVRRGGLYAELYELQAKSYR